MKINLKFEEENANIKNIIIIKYVAPLKFNHDNELKIEAKSCNPAKTTDKIPLTSNIFLVKGLSEKYSYKQFLKN